MSTIHVLPLKYQTNKFALLYLISYGQSEEAFYFQNLADSIFTGFFTLELIVKLYAMGKEYFKTGWNILDFSLVILGLIGMDMMI
mgnify:CR=1 FL=1